MTLGAIRGLLGQWRTLGAALKGGRKASAPEASGAHRRAHCCLVRAAI